MKISDLISMCARNLIRRKFRTFLTVMGVVIGTTSIIMMISLGIGISTQLDEQIKMWGDLTMITVYFNGGSDSKLRLDDEAVRTIQQLQGVDVATPFAGLQVNSPDSYILGGTGFKYRANWPSLYGIYPEALEKMGYTIKEGTTLPTGKTKTLKAVAGGSFAYDFADTRKKVNNRRGDYPDENGVIPPPFFNPLESELKLVLELPASGGTSGKTLEYPLEIVGSLVSDHSKWETVSGVFLPLDEINRIQKEFQKESGSRTAVNQKISYNNVRVKVLDINDVTDIEAKIKEMGFGTSSRQSEREQTQQSMLRMQMILGGIGAITLLVSAISITNTMIMSVYERTREIGVMKVLGCLVGNIRSIFLLEAGIIGFCGGIIGILLSFLLSFLLNYFGGAITSGGGLGGIFGGGFMYGMQDAAKTSIIPPWLVLLGLAFATGIGLVSGFYPANRAVKISALEAIKQE